jgi:hypothetical protein
MEIQARWKNLRTCFKRELDSQKNATSGESSRKRRKYLYFDQLLFFLPHTEDRETQSNLNSLNDEGANSSQEEEKKRPRNVRKKEANRNFLRGITTADFAAKKWTIQMQMKTSAFYCLYSYLPGRLMTNGSSWL